MPEEMSAYVQLRIAVFHAAFLGGGAERVAIGMVRTLLPFSTVTLYTFTDVDWRKLEYYYGLDPLSEGDLSRLRIKRVPGAWLGRSDSAICHRMYSIRQYLLSMIARQVCAHYDICISSFNELDMGTIGLQYVHAPMFASKSVPAREKLGIPARGLRGAVRRLVRVATGWRDERALSNVTLTNSQWTAKLLEETWDVRARVVYPPVSLNRFSEASQASWGSRRDDVICISRLVPEKRIERAIEIVAGLRQKGFSVHLHLIAGGAADAAYARRIENLVRQSSGWIHLYRNVTAEELRRLAGSCRVGLHVREGEQFGLAVAELVGAGCVVFVPRVGGQAEIVGHLDDVVFSDAAEAVEKISRILENHQLALHLQGSCQRKLELFSQARFERSIRQIVFELVEHKGRIDA